MKYTEYGLRISLEELEKMLAKMKDAAEHDNMESSIYINPGKYPAIKQYCCYAECNPRDYTRGVPIGDDYEYAEATA